MRHSLAVPDQFPHPPLHQSLTSLRTSSKILLCLSLNSPPSPHSLQVLLMRFFAFLNPSLALTPHPLQVKPICFLAFLPMAFPQSTPIQPPPSLPSPSTPIHPTLHPRPFKFSQCATLPSSLWVSLFSPFSFASLE